MHRNKRFRKVAIATGLVGALVAVTAFGVDPLGQAELPPASRVIDPLPLSLQAPEALDRYIQTETIRRGDTLALLLARVGANDPAFLRFASADPVARRALQMRAGRTVQAEIDGVGRILRFSYRPGSLWEDSGAGRLTPLTRIEIARVGDRLVAAEEVIPLERSVETRSVEIRSSLFAATDAAGIPEEVAIKVAEIFGGEIDFTQDLRKGDRLRVVYENVREVGSLDTPEAGRVLAIEFVNAGRRHSAFWLERGGQGEYFSFDGKSLKKAFLRNPLEFSRVTSGFTEARLHPILRDWRAHKGVDFAAPTGTRVRATGDGVVEFIGQQRGYGNVVILKHRGHLSTLYAHLNGFADGLRVGATVSQGDTIGTVGSTGWATGPHLHYEVKVQGEQVDPMKLALPESRALDGQDRQRLGASVKALEAQFAQIDAQRTARFQ